MSLSIHDRVALKKDSKKTGTVVFANEIGSRADIKWDSGEVETWNRAMLNILPKPAMNSFCGYCLINFRMKDAAGKIDTDDVVSNARTGTTFHLACARAIADTLKLYDGRKSNGTP